MAEFTVPQRKAYVKMLEDVRGKLDSWNNPWHKAQRAEKERLGKKHKVPELEKKVNDAEALVEKEMEAFEAKQEQEKSLVLTDIALAMAQVWGCDSAKEAVDIVGKYLAAEFPKRR